MRRFPHTSALVIGGLALLPIALLAIFGPWTRLFRSPSQERSQKTDIRPDPRVKTDSPFRNIHPDVKYVGDITCESCHAEIHQSYRHHPMGRSSTHVDPKLSPENMTRSTKNPFRAGAFLLAVETTDDTMTHLVSVSEPKSIVPSYRTPVSIAIGSGTRGRSYLTVEWNTLWQSPISWFSSEGKWDVSPGFDLGRGGRRAIEPGCLFCHVNAVSPERNMLNGYQTPIFPGQLSIGCERCHGPGELHVQERKQHNQLEKIDTSIVNPKHLSQPLQSAICQQCHLQGEQRVVRQDRSVFEFRPGLPLDDFLRVFVRPRDAADLHRSVGQFEQIEASRCRTTTGERLLCTTCHDPHKQEPLAVRETQYRAKCLECHTHKPCTAASSLRESKRDNCVHCHMPRTGSSNISHATITDHRIFRQPPPATTGRPSARIPQFIPFTIRPASSDTDLPRDLGIALSEELSKISVPRERETLARVAHDSLATCHAIWTEDELAWRAMSKIHHALGNVTERLDSATTALRLAGNSEKALVEFASAAYEAKQFEKSAEALTKAIQLNPRSLEHRLSLALLFVERKQWDRVEEESRRAVEIQPLHPTGRLFRAISLYNRGQTEAGLAELDFAMRLTTTPEQKTSAQDLFFRSTR